MNELGSIVELLQGGGNVALIVACFFIFKAEQRLSRIEKTLEIFLLAVGNDPTLRDVIRERLKATG